MEKKIETVTILVCTPDIDSQITKRCIDSIKKHTNHIRYELLLFENGNLGQFQHPLEVNRVLEIALGDVVVTLDDDVELTHGWLEAMIALAAPDVGIVGCVNLNGRKELRNSIRSCGFYVDYDGNPHHYTQPINKPTAVPYCCSCCWLIVDKSLRFDLRYEKYFQEGDLCLRCWEKGKKVIVSPHSIYHLGQGQMEVLGFTMEQILKASKSDGKRFKTQWIDNGRMAAVYEKIRNVVDVPLPEGYYDAK